MAQDNFLPDPNSAPELFESVLKRRVGAYVIDLVILTFMVGAALFLSFVSGFVTFGLGWLSLPVLAPLALVIYYSATLGTPRRATVGMSMMDLVLTPTGEKPLDGITAFLHPLVFWLSFWFLAPISLLVALVTPRRQMLHDYLLGTLMLRRSPLERTSQGLA
jgi:uncharacterized RDD family membrane protein YckC